MDGCLCVAGQSEALEEEEGGACCGAGRQAVQSSNGN